MGDLGCTMLDPGGGLVTRDELKTQFMTREGEDLLNNLIIKIINYRHIPSNDFGRIYQT